MSTATTATFHYVRDGEVIESNVWEINGNNPQVFADYLAGLLLRSYCDTVQVWFGPLDGREPDAVAEVPA